MRAIVLFLIILSCITAYADEVSFYTVRQNDRMLCKVNLNGEIEELNQINVGVGKYIGFDFNPKNKKFYAVIGLLLYEVNIENGHFELICKFFTKDNFVGGIAGFLSFNSEGEMFVFLERSAIPDGKLYKLTNIDTGELTPVGNKTSGLPSIVGLEFDDEDNLWSADECCKRSINKFDLNTGEISHSIRMSNPTSFPTDLDYNNGQMYFINIFNEVSSERSEIHTVDLETGQNRVVASFNTLISGLVSTTSIPYTPKSCNYSLFDYSNLEVKTNLVTQGDLLVYKDFIRMTDNYQYQKSFINYKDFINITKDFQTSFNFRINDNNRFEDASSKEDGFALIFYNDSTLNFESIKSGHFYEGFKNSLVIEIDLFQNFDYFRDPNDNHLAIFSSKNEVSLNHERSDLVFQNLNIPKIQRDNREYTLTVKYDEQRARLTVDLKDIYSQNSLAIINNFKFQNHFDLIDDKFAKIGILSSTGKTFQIQEISEWKYCSTEEVEILKEEGGEVYPNPAFDFIYLTDFNNIVKVRIIDVFGKEHDNFVYDRNLKRIDISNLKMGIYVLVIETENNTYIRKFIKS